MGQTNLKLSLERKFATWAHELGERYRPDIDFTTIEPKTEREARVIHLIHCAQDILREIDPTWDRTGLKPFGKHTHTSAVEFGSISTNALEIIRSDTHALTSREVASLIAQKQRLACFTAPDLTRLANSVDATLHARLAEGKLKHDGGYPRRWSGCL